MWTITKAIIASIALWLVLGFIVSSVGNKYFIPTKIRDLVERGQPTYGEVVRRDVKNHRRIDYTYSVNGVEYAGFGQGGGGNADFDELTVGTTVWVYYDPEHPSTSHLGSPEYEIESTELLIRAAAITVPFWPVIIFFLIYVGVSVKKREESQVGE